MPRVRESQRFYYIDLLRGFAAIAVLISHYRWVYARDVGDWNSEISTSLPFYNIFWPFYEHAHLAVPMFWAISGFVFILTYGFKGVSINVREFWIHRFARLYPLHFLTLIIVGLVQVIGFALNNKWQIYGNNDFVHFIAQVFLASNWFTAESSFNGPIWSVSLELIIYAVFIVLVSRFGFRLVGTAVVALVFVIIERITHAPLAWCGAMFYTGAVLAFLVVDTKDNRAVLSPNIAIMAGFVGISVCCAITYRINHASDAVLSYIGMPAMLAIFASLDLKLPSLPKKYWVIGSITYAVYLVHMPVIISAKTFFPAVFSEYSFVSQKIVFLCFLVTVIAISIIAHYKFELVAQKFFRKKFQ